MSSLGCEFSLSPVSMPVILSSHWFLGHFLGYQIKHHSVKKFLFRYSLVYLMVALVCEDEDAGDSDTPKRSSKPLSLNEKMDVLDLIRKEKSVCSSC